VAITESSADDKALVVQHHMNNSGNSSSFVVPVRQRYIPFAAIRALSPQEFVDLIVKDLGAAGVVCGANYRFGESPSIIIPTQVSEHLMRNYVMLAPAGCMLPAV
jgi:hypothetical protein